MILGLYFLLAVLLGLVAVLIYRKIRFGSIDKYKSDDDKK